LTKSFNVFLFLIGALFHLKISALDKYIYPYNDIASYSNYGTIGLIQVPSARMLSEGNLALSWTSNSPYKRGSVVAYPFSWLEVSYQYTDIDNALYSDVPLFSGSQTFKDKSFSAKVRLLSENLYRPEVSLGFRELAGTGVISSE